MFLASGGSKGSIMLSGSWLAVGVLIMSQDCWPVRASIAMRPMSWASAART